MSPRTYVGLAKFPDPNTIALLSAPDSTIKSACMITSKITGQPFGYGFVEGTRRRSLGK